MKSVGNRDVVQRGRVLRIHVFLAVPLGACHVAESSIDQRQDRVPVQECPNHASPAADLTVQWLNHVVGADMRPVFAGKVTVGQCLLNTIFFGKKMYPKAARSHTNSLGCIFLHVHATAENVFICYQ